MIKELIQNEQRDVSKMPSFFKLQNFINVPKVDSKKKSTAEENITIVNCIDEIICKSIIRNRENYHAVYLF